MKLSQKIKKLRREKGWSQTDLAEKLGVHLTHISRLETGKYMPSVDVLKKIIEVFEIPSDYLLYDNLDTAEGLEIRDKSMYERIKILENLDKKDKEIIFGVIDAFLVKRQMQDVLEKVGK
jgi:transcriptional regulator with XRE-family HTH domain